MKGFICALAFVAYASASGISSYGSGVGLAGSDINLGSVGYGSGIVGTNSGLGVKRISVTQPIYSSSGNIGLSGLSGSSYGSGIGLKQGVSRISVAQPTVITGRSLAINSAPIRSVSVIKPKLINSNYGITTVQKVRPYSYAKPIATVQPIKTVKVASLPVITAQPIRTVKVVARQPKIIKSTINLSGASFGSGLGISQPKLIPVSSGIISSGISKQVNLRPVTISQPKVVVQPIRTLQIPSQPIIASSKINLGGATYGSRLGRVSVVQPSLSTYGSIQPSISAGSNYLPIST